LAPAGSPPPRSVSTTVTPTAPPKAAITDVHSLSLLALLTRLLPSLVRHGTPRDPARARGRGLAGVRLGLGAPGEMTEASRQPKDKNYYLIAVLYQSSDNVESLGSYIQDAQREDAEKLVDFFDGYSRTT
jgi:hypothetical protein